MTLREATFNLIDLISGGMPGEGAFVPTERHAAFLIRYYRALLTRRDSERGLDADGLSQVIAVTMEAGPTLYGVGGQSIATRTSTAGLPARVRLKGPFAGGILRVDDGAAYVQYVPEGHFMNAASRRWVDHPVCTLQGDTLLYYHATDTPATLNVEGVWADPEVAHDFGRTIPDFDASSTAYPLPEDLYQRIAQGLLSGELRMLRPEELDEDIDHKPS